MSNFNENAGTQQTSINQSQSGSGTKKASFWDKANDNLEGVNKVIDSGKKINENLGNPLGFVAKGVLNKLKKLKQKDNGDYSVEKKHIDAASKYENIDVTETICSANEGKENLTLCEERISEISKTESDKPAIELLEKQLQVCSENPSYDDAVREMITAELGTLKMLKSADASLMHNFDNLVLEHLRISYENINDENNQKNFRKNAGLLIHSLVSYLQARIVYLENKKDSAQDFVNCACDDLGKVSYFILGSLTANETKVDVEGITVSSGVGKIDKLSISPQFNQQTIKNACDELRKIKSFGILTRLFYAKTEIRKEKENFYLFLAELFENVKKYRKIFGDDNRLLSQLIEHYGSIIAKEHCFSEEKINEDIYRMKAERPDLIKKIPRMPLKFSFASFVVIVLVATFLVDCGVVYAIRNIDYFVLVMVLVIILSIIISGAILGFACNELFDDAEDKWNERKKECMEKRAELYYKGLAKMFYDFDKN